MGLIQYSEKGFQLHNSFSHWKIDCDCLTDDDIEAIAKLLSERIPIFSDIVGIPTGGLRLAKAMEKYMIDGPFPLLIVDDVLTTGKTMERYRDMLDHPYLETKCIGIIGAVIFARGDWPEWIIPLFILGSMWDYR